MNAMMGAVQGPLFPVSTVFLSRWLPSKVDGQTDEKAWGTSLLDIGISVGAFVIVPLSSSIAAKVGWRYAYQVVGLAGLVYVALWQALGAEDPQHCWYISKEEQLFLSKHITKSTKQQGDSAKRGSLGMPGPLLRHRALWAIFGAHMAFNYGAYFITNWSPEYYAQVFELKPDAAKWYLSAPHITNLVCKIFNPALVRLVDRQGIGLLPSRKLFTAAGFLLSAITVLPMYSMKAFGPLCAMVMFSVANAFFGLAPVGFKSNYLDVTEQYVGVVSGIGNTLGTGASYVGPIVTSQLLQHYGGWPVVLASIAVVNLLASYNFIQRCQVVPIERNGFHLKSEQSFDYVENYGADLKTPPGSPAPPARKIAPADS